jgi:hypothetical protein
VDDGPSALDSRDMPRAIHRGRVRLQSYVNPPLADRVGRFCAAMGISESALVKSALEQYLDGTADATLVLRRLDRLGRAGARTQRDLELLSEAFAVYIRVWFAHTPNVPEDAKPGARRHAEGRYQQFVQHVAEQFSGGRRFLDDLPHEPIADEAELATLAKDGDAEALERKGGGSD